MKIFITGASGYLGRRVGRAASEIADRLWCGYASSEPTCGEPVRFDLLDGERCERLLQDLRPDAIIHCAAVNPGKDQARMQPVNVDGSRAVARAAARFGVRLVHVSTDVVHDGSAGPYADDAPPSPLGLYAETKAAGEQAVLQEAPERTISVRTSLIYDLDEIDNGTASFLERLEQNPPLRLFRDVLRQPVYAPALAQALVRLAASAATGFVNVAGAEALTREQFGRRMLAHWGADPDDPRIESISAQEEGIRVPLDLRLDLSRSRKLGLASPGVGEVLG